MTKGPRPEREWRSMHMGRHDKPKISHRFWVGAWLHKRRHVNSLKIGADRLGIYPCWFTDGNEFGRKHWHIGHNRLPVWLSGPQGRAIRHGHRARVKAISEGGYRIAVVLTEPELARLEKLAPEEMPLPEFISRALLGLARTGSRCCHLDPASCLLEASKNGRRQIS